jgi:hypothetical protein
MNKCWSNKQEGILVWVYHRSEEFRLKPCGFFEEEPKMFMEALREVLETVSAPDESPELRMDNSPPLPTQIHQERRTSPAQDPQEHRGDGAVTAADTSIEAYHDLAESGRLGEQTQEVLKALKALHYPPAINELSIGALAGWEKNTLSSRFNDLKDEGLIHSPGKRADKHTGRKSRIWELTNQ